MATHKTLLKIIPDKIASNEIGCPKFKESEGRSSPLIFSAFAKLKPDENWRLNALLSKPIILTTVF